MSDQVLVAGSSKTGAEQFGYSTIVPTTPQSHLMYYLSCVNTLLKSKGEQTDREMKKLCDFKNYQRLTEKEVDQMILLCFLLSPDVLLNKCVFVSDELCQDYDNNFYEINKVSRRFVVSRELLIGGETRQVARIMACRQCWLEQNWITPMKHFEGRLLRIVGAGTQEQQRRRPMTAPSSSGAGNQAQTRPSTASGGGSQSSDNSWRCTIS